MWKWHILMAIIKFFSWGTDRFLHHLRNLQSLISAELDASETDWNCTTRRVKHPDPRRPLLDEATRAAVILQGPLRREDDFTLETVRFYRQSMPGARLIVSTWDTEDSAALLEIERAGAMVLLSTDPEYPGPVNVNRQLRTTRAGIAAAQDLGCRYILKTRTDTRMYAFHVLDYLVGLQRSFPLAAGTPQYERLIILDYATRLLIPNHPSDLMMFGRIEDIAAYWGAPFSYGPDRPPRPRSMQDLWNEQTPEVYLCETYLQRIGYPYQRSITSWWNILAELFVVVDRASIEHFWPKYEYSRDHRKINDEQVRAMALCTFREWMNLYTFPKRLDVPDERVTQLKCDALVRAA